LPPAKKLIVRIEQLVKIYRQPGADVEVQALRGVSLDIAEGEYVAIVGASGSGKSTLMNVLGCLDRPTAGRYVLGGQDVSLLDDDTLSELRGKTIGFIFQSFNLIQSQTVLENLEVPLFYQGVPPLLRRQKATELANLVEIGDRLHHKPSELSGGQQQRVAIARSLSNDPLLLLADEPTGNLDSKTGQVVLEILDRLHESGMTIIMVTHDAEVAQRCRRIVEFKDGLIVSDLATSLSAGRSSG
jgi:putative ABC transport system ATP-binding protein